MSSPWDALPAPSQATPQVNPWTALPPPQSPTKPPATPPKRPDTIVDFSRGLVSGATGSVRNWVASSDVGRFLSPAQNQTVKAATRVLTHPVSMAWNAVQGGIRTINQAVENRLTGKQGYERALMESGIDPKSAPVGAAILHGTLDVSNILAAPGAIGKGVTLIGYAGKAAQALARAAKLDEGTATVVGTASRLLNEGRITAPVARRIGQAFSVAVDQSRALREQVRLATNAFYGTPDELRGIVEGYRGSLYEAAGVSINRKAQILDHAPTPADRVLFAHALDGTIPEDSLPMHLRETFQRFATMRDETTDIATTHQVIDEARDNYILHLYGPEDYARIRARAVTGGTVEEGATVRRRGQPQAEREYRAQQRVEAMPETGPRSAFGQQILPQGSVRSVNIRSAKRRVFDTMEEAVSAGLHPVEDVAVLIPAHDLSVRVAAANVQFYKKIAALGQPWVGKLADVAAQEGRYVAMADLIGKNAAVKYGMEGQWVHPRVAEVVKNVLRGAGRFQDEHSIMGQILNVSNNGLKRVIFWNPSVHGANIVRAAYLEHGAKLFTPQLWREWQAAVDDYWMMGDVTRARLKAGGQVSGGVGQFIMRTMDRIVNTGPVGEALRGSGFSWENVTRIARAEATEVSAGKGLSSLRYGQAYLRSLDDQVLWDVLDAGFRNMAFQHGIKEGLSPETAARFADDVLNRYAKEDYSKVDHALNQLIFVYAWTRGRAQFFRQMARAYGSGTDPETQLWRAMAGRWALTNVVAPHLYRSFIDRATLGFEGARIPVGERQTPSGKTVPLYMKPTGWYNDIFEFLQDPAGFGYYRLNPALLTAAQAMANASQAALQGEPVTEAMLQAIPQSLSRLQPAGLGQLMQGGTPWYGRIAPALGVPTTGPPREESPMVQLRQLLDNEQWFEAGAMAHREGLPFYRTMTELPSAARREFAKGYASGFKRSGTRSPVRTR